MPYLTYYAPTPFRALLHTRPCARALVHCQIWDAMGGGKLVQECSNHQKTITCLALDSTRTRLLTGALDCLVKIYSLSTYQVRCTDCAIGLLLQQLPWQQLVSPHVRVAPSAVRCVRRLPTRRLGCVKPRITRPI
jgi:hypothetical protein